MDQIFTKDALKAQIVIQALEMEMREKYYKHIKIKPAAQDGISRAAFNYIYFMFCYMKEYYQEDKQTISEMMQQLYKILVTGDYLCYECKRTKGYGQKIFEGVKTLFGYGKMLYCAEMLYYYYNVREKKTELVEEWMNTSQAFQKFLTIPEEWDKKVEKKEKEVEKRAEKQVKKKTKTGEVEFMKKLKLHMDQNMAGQERLKKKMCVLLYQWKYHHIRSNFLMIGPSGSGKNHMINTIKSFPELGMPLTTYDCSQLTAAGFTGDSTKDIFQKYKDENRAENTPAKYGIIYLDEIDKIINTHYYSQDENCNAFVQQQLLSALAGTEKFETIDTSKILFILGGAFPRLHDLEKYKTKTVGFHTDTLQMVDLKVSLRDKIIEIGGETEFIGRISQIEEMNSLTRADLKTILLDPKIGELSKLKKVYQQSGFTLEVKETVIEEILDSVEHDPAGARSVKNTLNGLIDLSYFFDMAMSGYKKIIIHEGMLYGEPPHFMYGSSGKEEERWSL